MGRKVAWLVGIATLLGTGTYIFVYLYRWEFHRALIVGMLFIAAEVAVATALIIRQIGKAQQNLTETHRAQVEAIIRERLDEAVVERDHFEWLRQPHAHTNVFIPILLGSGVIVSAAAWALERLASRTTDRSTAHQLAEQLEPIAFPPHLVVENAELLDAHPGKSEERAVQMLIGPKRWDS